jgi:hypothetical protein
MEIRIHSSQSFLNGDINDLDCIKQAEKFLETCNEHIKMERNANDELYKEMALYLKSLGGSAKKSNGLIKVEYEGHLYTYASPQEAFYAINKIVESSNTKKLEKRYLAEIVKRFPGSYIDPEDEFVFINVDTNADDYQGPVWFQSAAKAAEHYGITLSD